MTRLPSRWPLCCVAALLLLGGTAAGARAQYGYGNPGIYGGRYPNGIYGRGYGYLTGYGNALQGQATVMDAYGNLGLQSEQARIMREQAEQAKLVTKRQTFDEMKYERENTESFTEKLEKNEALKIRRLINNPLPAEVTSGSAFNTLLPFLSQVAQNSHSGGPPVPLDQELLKQINVSSGIATAGAGVLKDGGKVTWPFPLRGSMQEELDPLLQQAVNLAAQNKMTPKLYNQITGKINTIFEDLRTQFHKEEIDGSAFLEGKRFIDSLNGSVALLKSPNASKYFNGTYAARGNTVDELVLNMTTRGLKFAPAQPGNEDAYFALQSALQQYATASHGGAQASFRLRVGSTVAERNYGKNP